MLPKKSFLSLNKKLLYLVLLTSSAFTIVTTLLNFYVDYNSEKEIQLQSLYQIEKSTLSSITKAVWDIDNQQLQRNVNGLMQLHDVVDVKVYDHNDEALYEKAKRIDDEEIYNQSFEKVYPLNYKNGENTQHIGSFKLRVTNYYLYKRIMKKMIVFFLSQGAKTVIVSFILLFLFNIVVTKHITTLSEYCRSFDINTIKDQDLVKLDRKQNDGLDELDVLAKSLNDFVVNLVVARKEKEKELNDKEMVLKQLANLAALGEMAGNIGHEINNPLTIITGANRRLKSFCNEVELKEEQKTKAISLIDKIANSSERLGKISKGLSVLSRSGDDEFVNVPLKTILEDVTSIMTEKLRSKSIEFEQEIADENFLIKANRIKLGQVLVNIFNNAIHAIEDNDEKWLKLIVKDYSEEVIIKIVDSGKGIDKDKLESIFVPFYTTKEVGKGTGLGLSICSKMVKLHQGEIYVDENAENTTFCIKLPRADKFDHKLVA